jgi:putative ABC transport system permease protein
MLGTLIVLVVALACGLAPARFAARAALTPAVEGDGRVVGSGGGLRATLAVAQVASAIVLLCGAALLLRSFLALEDRDPGFRANNILTATVNLPFPFGGTRRYATDDALRQYYDGVEREVRMIPGVRRVAWGSAMPLDGFWSGTAFQVAGDPPRPAANRDIVDYHLVSASYFSTLGISILRGRDFTPADTAGAAPVCIVNEAFVRRYLRGRNPIGMRLQVQQQTIASPGIAAREIVGLARQVRARPNETDPVPQVYVPLPQNPWYQATLIVQSATPAPERLLPAMRAAAARIDPDQALMQARTLDTIASEATARWRFRAQLVGAFAALALTLAIVGVFGLLAYSVQQRTREFGLRLAIGARGTDIAGLVLGGTARIATAGMVIGILAAAVLSRGMASLLFGVTPFDSVSFSSSAAVLAVTALLAAIGPVRRAMRINPAALLKGDG